MLPTDITTVLMLALALTAGPILVAVFRRNVTSAMVAVAVLALLSGEEGVNLSLTVLGIQAFPSQIIALLLLAAALIRMPRARTYVTPAARTTLVVLWLACGASLFRGLSIYGPGAGDDARVFFDFLAVATYFATWEWDAARLRRLGDTWVRLALLLTVLGAYHVATRGVGDANTLVEAGGGQLVTSRALWSAQALVVGQAFVILLWHRLDGGRRWSAIPVVWLGVWVLVLQHRSVWVATAAAVAVLALLNRRPSRTTMLLAGSAAIVLFAAGAASGRLGPITDNLRASVATASTHEGTFGDRLNGWRFLIDETRANGPYAVAFGAPFGTSYTHTVGVLRVNLQPHNYFVQAFLRLGIVGASALVLFVVTPLRRRRATDADAAYFPWPVRASLTVALGLYLCTYPAPSFEAALLVPLICLARAPRTAEVAASTRDLALAGASA